VLLHGAAAILLWQLLKRLRVPGAWLAGAIFALHPVCVMSVAWITELKNVLSTTLALGATLAYLRATGLDEFGETPQPGQGSDRPINLNLPFYALSIGLFLLAMLAKTAVSFLPITLLIITWWRRRKLTWPALWPVLPMLGIVALLGYITVGVETSSGGAVGEHFHLSFPARVLVSGRSFWFYLEHALVPRLSPFLYGRWDVNPAAWWQWLFPAATIALLAAAWQFRQKIGRGTVAALLHFFLTTSFLILLVVPYFTTFSFVSDHWQYYGMPALAALVAAGIVRAVQVFAKGDLNVQAAVGGVLLAGLGVLTWFQCGMYRNGETLWSTTIKRSPDCAQAHTRYGDILFQRHDVDNAVREFQTAITLDANDPETHYNLGNAFAQQGHLDLARNEFAKVLELEPASRLGHNGMGKLLSAEAKYDEAVKEFEKATNGQPPFIEAHLNLGNAFMATDHLEDAKREYSRVIELDPNNFAGHLNLGTLLARDRQLDAAIQQFSQAEAINPHDAMVATDLGTALLQKGLLPGAAQEFQKAAQISPSNYSVHVSLGIILYQMRQVDEAIDQFKTAMKLRPDRPEAADRLNRIAWIFAASPVAASRDGKRSLALVEELMRQEGSDDPNLIAIQAAAYAESGKFSEAVAAARKAVDLAGQENAPADIRAALNEQLESYRNSQPFRDTNLIPHPAATDRKP